MGRLEKIVVVTVLFLVAVILGVSLNTSSEDAPGKGPLAKNGGHGRRNQGSEQQADEQSAKGQPLNANGASATPPAAPPNGLLSASVAPANAASNPAASNAPMSSAAPANAANAPATAATQPVAQTQFLATRDGLEPTASDDWMLYTWKAGDTFKDLAQRYYGSPLHVARVRAANEGRDETKIAPGEKILIAAKSATALEANAHTPQQPAKPGEKKNSWAGGMYEVKSGDVLGTIAKQVYGSSKSWKKIYDANRDVIGDNPNTLKVGSKLRIPE
jgi:nucleoid-associated protein YgaU